MLYRGANRLVVAFILVCLLGGIFIFLKFHMNQVPRVGLGLYKGRSHAKSAEFRSSPQSYPTNGNSHHKVHVIIVARWRYGSSFTGEIFNQNYDFSYFYEPLRFKFGGKDRINQTINKDHINMLHDVLKCDFADKNYTWWLPRETGMNCARSKKFGTSTLCKKNTVFSETSRSNIIVEEICRSGKHVAIKTVRVPDLIQLQSIVMDDSLNVKVIQLVRDPRGISLSKSVVNWLDDFEESECDELRKNLNYWKDPPSWLKDRYMLLRYEDLVDDPIQLVQIIYNFLDLPAPEHVKTWLRVNADKMSSQNKSAYSWRAKIDYDMVNNVQLQSQCMDLLLMTGYKPINSVHHLRDLEIPSIDKRPYPLMPNMTLGVNDSSRKIF